MAVVGLYDKGKTFVLNNLSFSNLPSGKKVNTKGLSFKYVDVDEGTKLILLDTAGSYSPVKVENNMSIVEREATEHFILELVFDVADYFLFVVNDFTSLDQRYLDKLSRSLQTSANKAFREVIVIHNFKVRIAHFHPIPSLFRVKFDPFLGSRELEHFGPYLANSS